MRRVTACFKPWPHPFPFFQHLASIPGATRARTRLVTPSASSARQETLLLRRRGRNALTFSRRGLPFWICVFPRPERPRLPREAAPRRRTHPPPPSPFLHPLLHPVIFTALASALFFSPLPMSMHVFAHTFTRQLPHPSSTRLSCPLMHCPRHPLFFLPPTVLPPAPVSALLSRSLFLPSSGGSSSRAAHSLPLAPPACLSVECPASPSSTALGMLFRHASCSPLPPATLQVREQHSALLSAAHVARRAPTSRHASFIGPALLPEPRSALATVSRAPPSLPLSCLFRRRRAFQPRLVLCLLKASLVTLAPVVRCEGKSAEHRQPWRLSVPLGATPRFFPFAFFLLLELTRRRAVA